MVTWNSGEFFRYQVVGGVGAPAFLPAFTASGTTDTNYRTRLQYDLNSATGHSGIIGVRNNITVPWEDFAASGATGPDKALTERMFLVPATAFAAGVTPTPLQIMGGGTLGHAGVRVFRPWRRDITHVPPSGPGGYEVWDASIDGPLPHELSANSKYWLLIMPVVATVAPDGSTPTRVFTPVTPGSGGSANTIGRAFSFWTNRRPLAPVITAPTSGSIHTPGSNFNLEVDFRDPDAVGTSNTPDSTGVNGVQIQYRPRFVADAEWTNLPFYSNSGAVGYTLSPQPGWTIYGSNFERRMAGTLIFGACVIRGGGDPLIGPTAVGYLPKGDWKIRVRSFDPGNAYNFLSSGIRCIDGVGRNYTPNNYPASLISPWSTPINITIPAQIPPPLLISPINGNALPEGEPITLVWNYRNTSVPPEPQIARTIEIRQTGEENWTTLVSGASAASFYEIPYDLEATHEYQWRVQTTDATSEVSDFSEIGYFWVVPAPASGGGRPVPADSIRGATLGCGTHRIEVFRRGGKIRVAALDGVSYLDWGRVRDDISTAKVVISDWSLDCGNLLALLKTWAYEIVIFRDNGYGTERVWEGPITLLTYERDKVTIQAKDVMAYVYRRIIKQAMTDTGDGDTVTNRAVRVLQNTLGPDDPNLLPYLTPIFHGDDAREYRSIPAYSRTGFEEIDDMAANAGLDYTAVGRAILLWSTKHRIGTLPEFRDADFGAPPIVSEYGMSMANVYSVSDGNGIHGEATRLDENDQDLSYGLVEMLSSTWASDTQQDQGTYTQEGLQTVIASFQNFAERSIATRYPPPVVVRVPDNTTLNPDAVISIQQLVPGVVIPLRSTGTLRTIVGNQKLDSMKVVEESGNETISISLSPFSRDDTAAVSEEGD